MFVIKQFVGFKLGLVLGLSLLCRGSELLIFPDQ